MRLEIKICTYLDSELIMLFEKDFFNFNKASEGNDINLFCLHDKASLN